MGEFREFLVELRNGRKGCRCVRFTGIDAHGREDEFLDKIEDNLTD